jgi:hypothetical protein
MSMSLIAALCQSRHFGERSTISREGVGSIQRILSSQRYGKTEFLHELLENDVWPSNLHECDWYKTTGLVQCKRVKQMEMITIDGNGLQGILPIVLSIFSTISELMLSSA